MKRLLVVTDRYPPYHTGGDETSCQAIVEGLSRRGYDVFVLTSTHGVGKRLVEERVYRQLSRPGDTASLFQQAVWELEDHRSFRELVDRLRPDAIASWCTFSLFPSMHFMIVESGLPVVYNMQNMWIHRWLESDASRQEVWQRRGTTMLNRLAKRSIRFIAQVLDHNWLRPLTKDDVELRFVVQCSDASRRVHHDAGFRGDEWVVIYNGINLDRFQGSVSTESAEDDSILFAGRLVKDKGLHTLIEAVGLLVQRGHTQVRLTVAGVSGYPPAYVESLHRLVEDRRISEHVVFLGAVPHSQMPALFQKHAILTFPSIAPEGFPMTLIEAMACGLAVVGTTTGGSSEILENNVNGLTFTPGNTEELASCLERLIADSSLRNRLGREGRQWVRAHCDINLVIDEWERYLKRVLNEVPGSLESQAPAPIDSVNTSQYKIRRMSE